MKPYLEQISAKEDDFVDKRSVSMANPDFGSWLKMAVSIISFIHDPEKIDFSDLAKKEAFLIQNWRRLDSIWQ